MLWLGDNPPPQSFLGDIPWTYGPIKSLGIYFCKNSVEANKLNWDDKIEKLKRILDNWRKRNLTFFGKVTVLKSLALSQIMYTAAVLYTPEWVIKQIRKLSLDFLWNNKKYKIKDTYLQRDYKNGGIKFIDIKAQIMSLKLKWIGRILDETNASWKYIPKSQFNKIGGLPLCLNYNLKLDHIKDVNKMSPFYEEIFKAWCVINSITKQSKNTQCGILNEVIWYNSNITQGGKPLFLKEWLEAGILTIRDIVDEAGFIDYLEIRQKMKSRAARATCFFDLERVKKCMKTIWKNVLRDVELGYFDNNNHNVKNPPSLKVRGKKYQIWQLKTKTFYEILTENNTSISRAQQYWQNKVLNNPIGQNGLEWHHVWEFRLKSIKDFRLKNFNFKFLYNIVPVKSNLFKWKLSDDDLCPECNIKEDILHAFLLCERVKAFWKWLGNIIKKLKVDYATFNIDSAVMIYGFNIENKKFKLLNFIVNCAMFVIYKCIIIRNFENKQYSFSGLQNMLYQELKNQICKDVKANYIRKFFSAIEIEVVKCYLT